MSKSDFLSWDDDIDLDALLGDYTEDNHNEAQHKKPKRDPPSDAGFRCPVAVECRQPLPVSVVMRPKSMINPITKVMIYKSIYTYKLYFMETLFHILFFFILMLI